MIGGDFRGRTMQAAVFRQPHQRMEVETVDVAEPSVGEVLIRMAASGVCHSDYHFFAGEWSAETPMVLGHEGAGYVEALGQDVEGLDVGDRVVLSWNANCRRCDWCVSGRPQLCAVAAQTTAHHLMWDGTTRLRQGDKPVYAMAGVGTFGEYAVVPESGAVRVAPDTKLDRAALVGCAVATGFGAVVNTADVPAGASVVVAGCGGVGLSVLQGAVVAAATPIIAVDVKADKLALAMRLGATHVIDAAEHDAVAEVLRLTGGRGVDFAFEAIGLQHTIEQTFDMIAAGGTAVIVGQAPEGVRVSVDALKTSDRELKIIGSNYGSCRPSTDFPRILDLHRRGALDLDSLISARIQLHDVNEAFDALKAGDGLRQVIEYPTGPDRQGEQA